MNAHDRRVMHSTGKDDWATPWPLFKALDERFGFNFDAAASPENAKCERFLTAEQDALVMPWEGRVWLNPPYSRDVGKWVERAYLQATTNYAVELVACLLYARTDTRWWHGYVMAYASEVIFLRGRVTFVGAPAPSPAPSAVVVFRRHVPVRPLFASMQVPLGGRPVGMERDGQEKLPL
jgi:phage N-6-adenine-methyltransferase